MSDKFDMVIMPGLLAVVVAPAVVGVLVDDARWFLLFMFLWAMSPFAFVWLANWWDRRR